ncbi:zinc finger and BTB domain-containing protein 12-like [Periophthalmus magnuspinnatus]|uniref:zinc finger and BTB domain-containing protein 12-like n=1 Tax=Periophthalmus magnuspinnatus TaxID=409849 RepID=UPI00145A66C7|nr:zinc finger and BTB domain-containing protein 12-like [Periophthalmus magnuspinnatus]XP_055081306.1 zinc finger and BTB domain-containing protein 12-like [Periophthalmus magnuspinnatus]
METLCFRLPGHGDSTLKHMDSLRSRQHFCDITIVSSDNQIFKGHKVVLAACSPYLRDQFLLNPSPKLQVSMLYSSSVVGDLLLSCYTGVLQFNSKEIVNYLTAASYLQMEHIVERCRGALKKYIQLNSLASLGTEEAGQSSPVIVTGSVHSVAAGPSPKRSLTPEVYDDSQSAHGSVQLRSDSPSVDNACIEVNESDEEVTVKQEDSDVYKVYISEEERAHRDAVEKEAQSEMSQIMIGEGGNYELQLSEEQPGGSRDTVENLRVAFKHRLSDFRQSKARGRGLKRRKWRVSECQQVNSWYVTNSGVGLALGSEYNHDTIKPGSYISVELPQVDYSVGEADKQVAPLALEEAGGGEGVSGLEVQPSEGAGGGDESVAVVGSTSSNGPAPVICDYCGLAFPSANILALHCRTSHMLYACPCCGKKFHHSANLSRHMAVHRTGGKSHPCPLCCKSFTQKSTLIDHMNLHSGEKPHRCAYCHARFAHKPALRRHLKEQHGKTTGQNSLEQQERDRQEAQQGIEQN